MKNHTKSRPAHFLARLQVFAKQKRQLKLPKFGFEYVCALLLDVQRKSLSAIGQAIGIHVSQISRMLGSSDFIASTPLLLLIFLSPVNFCNSTQIRRHDASHHLMAVEGKTS